MTAFLSAQSMRLPTNFQFGNWQSEIGNVVNLWMLFGYLLTEHHLSSCCGTFSTGVTIRHSTQNEEGTRKVAFAIDTKRGLQRDI
jgi:hypothetical protein